jgi:hypothetical protein
MSNPNQVVVSQVSDVTTVEITTTGPQGATGATGATGPQGPAISDGDKGDITVSGSGSSFTIDNDAVTYAKIQNVTATNRILGRDSTGAGVIEEITPANLRTMINVEDGATADQTNAEIKTAYEANSDTNAFTDAEKTKLSGIENSADVTDATNVNAAGAVMNSDLDGKGELLVGDGSGDPSALSVGTNGYVLKANSSTATGLEWAAESGGGGSVDSVSGTAPIVSSGGTDPAISISAATTSAAGSMSSSDKSKLDGIESGATADQTKSDIDALGIAASTATTLATARNIGGVSFNGSANINLPGVNTSGDQDTSGTAAIATTVTVADESSDTSCNVLFTTAATGNLGPKSGTNLTFNSSSGVLTATGFAGALTGNVTGNASGSSGSCTGNAATASALANARTIAGVSFDGTANISLNNNAITNGAGYTTNAGTVTGVSGTAPIVSSGGTTPAISISAATTSAAGSMSAADKTKLDGIETSADVTDATNVASAGAVMDGDFTSNGFMKRTGAGSYTVDTNTYLTAVPSGYLQNISEDSTPQLGGNLDVQTSEITTSTSNGNIKLNPNGTGVVEVKGDGSSADGVLQLNCSQNSHGVKLKSPAHSAAQSYTVILPDNQIAASKILSVKSISGSGSTAIGQLEFADLADTTKMPLAGGTFTGSVTFQDAINENVFTISDGASVDLDPDNGTIQQWTLGANRTATESLTAGQSMLLMVADGTSYTLTFPTITWVGGSAPTLATSGYTVIELFKVGSTLYGATVGDVA